MMYMQIKLRLYICYVNNLFRCTRNIQQLQTLSEKPTISHISFFLNLDKGIRKSL